MIDPKKLAEAAASIVDTVDKAGRQSRQAGKKLGLIKKSPRDHANDAEARAQRAEADKRATESLAGALTTTSTLLGKLGRHLARLTQQDEATTRAKIGEQSGWLSLRKRVGQHQVVFRPDGATRSQVLFRNRSKSKARSKYLDLVSLHTSSSE